MGYMIPLQGTFYVPPQYREIVAKAAPISGDFAQGVRNHYLTYPVGIAFAQAEADEPDA